MQVQSYLFFNGRCDEAIEFYRSALGAEVKMLTLSKECPEPNQSPAGHREQSDARSASDRRDNDLGVRRPLPGPAELRGPCLVDHRARRCRGRPAVQRARRRRPSANAAQQDVLFLALRHGRRSVRSVVDDLRRQVMVSGSRLRQRKGGRCDRFSPVPKRSPSSPPFGSRSAGWWAICAPLDVALGTELPAWVQIPGVVAIALGSVGVLTCGALLSTRGIGTLSGDEWFMPQEFLATGPFRYVRNSMSLAGVFLIVGIALLVPLDFGPRAGRRGVSRLPSSHRLRRGAGTGEAVRRQL